MADNLVYEESLNTEIDRSEFTKRQWIYVNDNNAQNYTSQIVIDTTPLSNAGQWVNWSEAFILMPLVVQLTSTIAASLPLDPVVGGSSTSTNAADWSWAFKNGFWNIINSMTVEFNNQNIIQQTPFTNVFRSFKAHTSFSMEDVINEGASIGYALDTAQSWGMQNNYYTTSTIADSCAYNCGGVYNNRNFQVSTTSSSIITPAAGSAANIVSITSSGVAGVPIYNATNPISNTSNIIYSGASSDCYLSGTNSSVNQGFLQRQQYVNYDPTNLSDSFFSLNQNLLLTKNQCETNYKNFKTQSQSGSIIWNIFAKLRLKDLADFFEKTPLLKGSTIRFYINTNQSIVSFNTELGSINSSNGTVLNPQLTATNVNIIGGLTNPLMITSNAFGNGGSSLAADSYQLSVSIFKNNFSNQLTGGYTAAQSPLPSCRLYAPLYTMNPLAESKYLSMLPTKKIMYKDIFQYQFSAQSGPFNILVTNGIANIQSVLVVPFLSQTNSFTNSDNNVVSQLAFNSQNTPYSTSPATPDPIILTNFNILVSGVNLFLNNENYDFEAFRQQLLSSNQLNGNLTTGLTSGLIGEQDFSQLYRYYYGNASRVLPSEEGVSRSVQIVGNYNNPNNYKIDLYIFVEFMREITIDLSTGARIE